MFALYFQLFLYLVNVSQVREDKVLQRLNGVRLLPQQDRLVGHLKLGVDLDALKVHIFVLNCLQLAL